MTTIADLVASQLVSELESLRREINTHLPEGSTLRLEVELVSPDHWAGRSRLGYEGPTRHAHGFTIAVCVEVLADRLAHHLGGDLDRELADARIPANGSVVDAYLMTLTTVWATQIAGWPTTTFDDALEMLAQHADHSVRIIRTIDHHTLST